MLSKRIPGVELDAPTFLFLGRLGTFESHRFHLEPNLKTWEPRLEKIFFQNYIWWTIFLLVRAGEIIFLYIKKNSRIKGLNPVKISIATIRAHNQN